MQVFLFYSFALSAMSQVLHLILIILPILSQFNCEFIELLYEEAD